MRSFLRGNARAEVSLCACHSNCMPSVCSCPIDTPVGTQYTFNGVGWCARSNTDE